MKTFNLATKSILVFFILGFTIVGLQYIFAPMTALEIVSTPKELIPGALITLPFIGSYLISIAALVVYVLKSGSINALKAFLAFSFTFSLSHIALILFIFSVGPGMYINLIMHTINTLLYIYLLLKNRK